MDLDGFQGMDLNKENSSGSWSHKNTILYLKL